jgi:hypothetical protein
MTTTAEILIDGYERIRDGVRSALEDLDDDALQWRPDDEANTIAWLTWHLSRVQDDHLSDASGQQQIWLADGWADRFDLPFDRNATGYGQRPEEVTEVKVDVLLLVGYLDAVSSRSVTWLGTLTDTDLNRIVDDNFDPPVTLAVRLVSVLADDLQHLGQIGYLRGLAARASGA